MGKIQSNFISVLKIWNDYLNVEQGRKIFNQFNIVEIMTFHCLSGAPKPVFGDTLERIEYTIFIFLIKDLIKAGEIKLLRAIGFIKSEFDEYVNSLSISIEQNKIDNTIGKLRTDYIQNQNNEVDLQRYNELLAKELEEQEKINSESVYIPPLNIADTDSLVSENNQLKIDNKNLTEQLNQAKKEIEQLTTFIQSNNITELTEEYLKSRERNNYYSLIGGLLYLLLTSSSKNLNQNAIILSLQEAFKGEPFSDRSLQDKFANAKRQLIANHPNIKFD